MDKKICLLSDHHLSINPRLWKEAFLYEKMGFDVVIITQWISDYFLEKDRELLNGHGIRHECYLDYREGQINPIYKFFLRLRKRLAGEMQRFFSIGTPWAITYAPENLFRHALRENADLYAAHMEAGFVAGRSLVKAGKKVSFDLEDWYSKDYPTPDRAKGYLDQLEGFALRKALFFTTTSEAMSSAIKKTWKSKKQITVIYNSFPGEEIHSGSLEDQTGSAKIFRLVWTSRTIGPNRGLEVLATALNDLEMPVELHIIGQDTTGYREKLQSIWPFHKGHGLVFRDFVRHHDLLGLIATFDLGVAVELKEPESRNKTITNKILQYIQAGIRVLASDTDGQKEVAGCFPGSVFVVPVEQPLAWADQIRKIIKERDNPYREQQRKMYNEKFAWPVQEDKLRHLINAVL